MAFKSNDNGVLGDASTIAPSRFQRSSLSAVGSNRPLQIYPPAAGSAYTSPKNLRYIPGKSENGRVNILEAMKASSPPHTRLIVDPFDKATVEAISDGHYRAWMRNHPSALSRFDQIVGVAGGKQIVLFLDYDGTLTPIVEDSECAFMSDEMRDAVRSLATYFPTAIISGRRREKVYDLVRLSELYYAGSHGMDIMGPAKDGNGAKANGDSRFGEKGEEAVLFQPASEFLVTMDKVFKVLGGVVSKVSGAKLEHNKFCVSVHFRCVDEEDWNSLAEDVLNVLLSFPDLCLTQGRKVLEIRPAIDWHKGKALEFLLEFLGLADCSDIFPIYIGDDRTDEDAFKVLKEQSQGLGILVSNSAKDTNAINSLRNPSEVLEFFLRLVSWRKMLETSSL